MLNSTLEHYGSGLVHVVGQFSLHCLAELLHKLLFFHMECCHMSAISQYGHSPVFLIPNKLYIQLCG